MVVRKLPNLPVFQVRPEGGKRGKNVIHCDHLLLIGLSVRLPNSESAEVEEVSVRPTTKNKRKVKHTTKQKEHLGEVTESSLEVESDRPGRSNRDYLDSLLRRKVTVMEREHVSSDEEIVRDIGPQHSDHEGETGGDDLGTQAETDWDDPGSQGETESEVPDFESEREISRNLVRTPRAKPSFNAKPCRELRQRTTEKRRIKPALRLTCDEPGKASEQPITIVHRGIIIKLGN